MSSSAGLASPGGARRIVRRPNGFRTSSDASGFSDSTTVTLGEFEVCPDNEPWRAAGLDASPCAKPAKDRGIWAYLCAVSIEMAAEGIDIPEFNNPQGISRSEASIYRKN